MTLRGHSVEETVALPDGRTAVVRVGVPDDPYLPKRELDTVAAELWIDGVAVASVNTLLEPEQSGEGRALAREIAAGLSSGELEPTAGAIEPVALRIPEPR